MKNNYIVVQVIRQTGHGIGALSADVSPWTMQRRSGWYSQERNLPIPLGLSFFQHFFTEELLKFFKSHTF